MYNQRICFSFFVLFVLTILLFHPPVMAQSALELITVPEIQRIHLGSEPKKIKIIVQNAEENLQFDWRIDGPGSFEGTNLNNEMFYIPPGTIENASVEVSVVVTGTNGKKQSLSGQVSFTLLSPPQDGSVRVTVDVPEVNISLNGGMTATAHPDRPMVFQSVPPGEALVCATVEGYPNQSRSIQVRVGQLSDIEFQFSSQETKINELLKQGDAFFEKQQFISPKKHNALKIYKNILKMEPKHSQARKRIHEMVNICTALGDNAQREKRYDDAKRYYEESLPIIDYGLNELKDQSLQPDFQSIQNKLKTLGDSKQEPGTEKAEITREDSEQDMDSTKVKALEDSEQSAADPVTKLLKEGNRLFEQRYFTMPKNQNAFDHYKAVLKIDPGNSHAKEKIYQIMRIYKKWAKNVGKEKNYTKANLYYQRYLFVANYISEVFGDRSVKANVQKIQQQLKSYQSIANSVDRLLKQGDIFFKRQQFISPQGKNAFARYKAVLKLDPSNRRACQKIHEMIKILSKQGDKADKEKKYEDAVSYYKDYLIAAQYAMTVSGVHLDELEFWKIQNRFRDLKNFRIIDRLKPFEQKLAENLEIYQTLKVKKDPEAELKNQILPVLKEIVGNLKNIEKLYEQLSYKDTVILDKINRVKGTREIFEKEILSRTKQ